MTLPTVDGGISHTSYNIQQTGARYNQYDSGFARQITHSLGCVAGGLLVAHRDKMKAGLLNGHSQLNDWESHDSEYIFDSLEKICAYFLFKT